MSKKAARAIFGAILIVSAIVLGVIGYQKNQPSGMESFASGMTELGAVFDSASKQQAQQDLDNMKSQQLQRALPFYIFGFIAGVAGIALLILSVKEEKNEEKKVVA